MIEKKEIPYEFLVRIDNGEISGAHVRKLEVVSNLESGEIYSTKEMPAQPINLTDEEMKLIMKRIESS